MTTRIERIAEQATCKIYAQCDEYWHDIPCRHRDRIKELIASALTAFAEEEADNLLQGFVLRERGDKDGWTLLKDGIAIAGGSKSHCLDALLAEALNRREV